MKELHPDAVKNTLDFFESPEFDCKTDIAICDPETGIVHAENFEAFMAKGRIRGCVCGLIVCECKEALLHSEDCHYREILLSYVLFECEHDLGVCPECDKCNCGLSVEDDPEGERRLAREKLLLITLGFTSGLVCN